MFECQYGVEQVSEFTRDETRVLLQLHSLALSRHHFTLR